MSMSEAFSIFYTLIKLHYTKALSDQALSLAPDWILLLQRPRIPVSRGSATIFQSNTYPYMTTGKIIALTIQIFVGKVMSLLFSILSRLVIASLPRNKCLNFVAAVTVPRDFLEPKKIKSVTASTFSPSICSEVMGPDAVILVFWRSHSGSWIRQATVITGDLNWALTLWGHYYKHLNRWTSRTATEVCVHY